MACLQVMCEAQYASSPLSAPPALPCGQRTCTPHPSTPPPTSCAVSAGGPSGRPGRWFLVLLPTGRPRPRLYCTPAASAASCAALASAAAFSAASCAARLAACRPKQRVTGAGGEVHWRRCASARQSPALNGDKQPHSAFASHTLWPHLLLQPVAIHHVPNLLLAAHLHAGPGQVGSR